MKEPALIAEQRHAGRPESAGVACHARSVPETLSALGTDPEAGLSPAEAAARLARVGPNTLTKPRREPWWEEVWESLTEPLQLLLLAVGAIYFLLGESRTR